MVAFSGDRRSLRERMIAIEILLSNHLKHHETINKVLLLPILVGIVLILAKIWFIR